ncbi:hypothetical protein PVAND_006735 [Polypedilum vanderplanki]|uniref:Uncharacterized protein n=1 Tax=Polypedilum vanderplanki TaxID=319348 RepID=A0A9J6C542_POLVA|nr:hypothetical protein PVAND_006735 [Polypedilum vanderplanki]
MINCVSTNSSSRQNILYMVRGIQTQDFLNILNKNNAKIAISQTSETNGSVGKLVLGTLNNSETTIQKEQRERTVVRLENSERILKNGQLIIKNIDKGHSVLVIRSANNDSSIPQVETKMSIEALDTMEANLNEDNESKMNAASTTQKIASLVGSGK